MLAWPPCSITQLSIDTQRFEYFHRCHYHALSHLAKAPTFAGSEGSFAGSEDDDSEDDNDEFDDMDNANEADADGAAEQDVANSSGNDSELPSPPGSGGQSEPMKRGAERHPKHSNAQDLRATGVARAAARLLQQDTPADGLGILSVRASAAATAYEQSCSLMLIQQIKSRHALSCGHGYHAIVFFATLRYCIVYPFGVGSAAAAAAAAV